MIPPSDEFLLLAATLIESLPPALPIDDSLLLQLHAVFGPMLMSALQLVDKREVVRVSLPSERFVYQVASSTGRNYTLYLDPPGPSESAIPPLDPFATETPDDPPPIDDDNGKSDTPPSTPSRTAARSPTQTGLTREVSLPPQAHRHPSSELELDRQKRRRIVDLSRVMKRMYCPCPGFAYNSLSGDRTVVCKHILAVVLAHKVDKDVKAEVGLPGVVGLLGLGG